MKQPSLSHLRIDRAATKKIRAALSKKKQVTITVHLDSDIPPPFPLHLLAVLPFNKLSTCGKAVRRITRGRRCRRK